MTLQGEHLVAEVFMEPLQKNDLLYVYSEGGRPEVFGEVFNIGATQLSSGINALTNITPWCLINKAHR